MTRKAAPSSKPPAAVNDPQRLSVLQSYAMLDTGPEPEFDDIVMLARQICGAPMALISLVDAERQWFKAASGLDICESGIETSVCAHALAVPETLNIADLTQDARTKDNPHVTGEPHLRFYAGAPLIAAEGVAIGTVCVVDTEPRPGGLRPEQLDALEALARQVMTQFELRRDLVRAYAKTRDRDTAPPSAAESRDAVTRYQTLFNSLDAGFCVIELAFDAAGMPTDYKFVEVNPAFTDHTGLHDAAGKWMREIAPAHEQHWFDLYGKVALTGQPARFEQFAEQLGSRWYEVHAFRIGAPDLHQVAILFSDITARRAADQQMKLINAELGHRMNNAMALVQAIATQTLRGVTERDIVDAFERRLDALSRAHHVLQQQDWTSARLRDVIAGVLEAHTERIRVRLDGPDIRLDPKAALSFSMLLHELATNAVKYGALGNSSGHVAVSWTTEKGELVFDWREQGGPIVTAPTRKGLGTRLIDLGIAGSANVSKSYDASGFRATFRAPLDKVEHPK
ncbi:sensor histidine kinase [Tardiphaga alba]|uniref:sensor histidine kinase n=1 Tax=Tardiphaga alba TaxID=340268 RepID=UPI001BAA8867|nr:HWE histidine kinase domain-containing protein [Tardiphaga alba]